MNKKITIILIFIGLTSCGTDSDTYFENATVQVQDSLFSEVVRLKPERIGEVSDSLLLPGSLSVTNDYLFINERKSDHYLHIIKIPENEYVKKYGNIGRGPGEILVPWKVYSSDHSVSIYDDKSRKIVEFEIDSLVNGGRYKKEYILEPEVSGNGAIVVDEKMYYSNFNNSENRFYEKDLEDGTIKGYGTLPEIENNFPEDRFLYDICFTKFVNHKDLFAFGYYAIPYLQLYDKNTDKWISIAGPENYIVDTKNINSKTFYQSLKVTDNYLYALYHGRDNKSGPNASILYVFDHNGKEIKKIALEEGIYEFDVYKDEFIYGLSMHEDYGFSLLKYEL